MPMQSHDGSILYWDGDQLTDVKLNGVSIWNLTVREVKMWPDTWGYVLTEKQLGQAANPVKAWVDNQVQRFINYGYLEITP